MNLTAKQQLVLDSINEQPTAADDEMLLLATVWGKTWDYNKSLTENLSHMIHPETISRRRRELFNMGLIKYSDKAMKDRTEAYKSEQDNHSDYGHKMTDLFHEPLERLGKLTIIGEAIPWLDEE